MSQSKPLPITADDPELTAFALGELDGATAARYAEAIAASAELQAVVAEIQAEARILSDELRLEPTVPMAAELQAEIIAQASRPQAVVAPMSKRFQGLSRRITVVAASVLLVPGAWYAFQAVMPKKSHTSLQVSATAPSAHYMNDDVQYFPSGPDFKLNRQQESAQNHQLSQAKVNESSPFSAIGSGSQPERRMIRNPVSGQKPVDASATVAGVQTELGDLVADNRTFTVQGRSRSNAKGVAEGKPTTDDFVDEYVVSESLRTSISPKESGKPDSALSILATAKPGQMPQDKNKPVSGRDGKPETESKLQARATLLTTSTSEAIHNPLPTSSAPVNPTDPDRYALGTLADGTERGRNSVRTKLHKESKELKDQDTLAFIELQQLTKKEVADLERSHPYPTKDAAGRKLDLGWAKRDLQWHEDPTSNEAYAPIYENAFINPAEQPLSTFSIDVDTASYSNLRRFLQGGQLPPPNAVRIEELVNYFAYQYPQPQDGRPFSVQTDIAACPWQPGHQLVRVGLKGKEIPKEQRPPTNLVFLVDVSGSMQPANKLPLVRESLKTLVGQLDERDKIAIVTYAGEAGIPLPSTSVAQRETIIAAINSLGAGGSTNGAAGINTAYDIAAQEFLDKGTNRVILCTDGDFNVGVTSDEALVEMIQTRAKGNVFLSVFGFGMGNLKDAKLEQLADKGNGQYGYIDDQQEANKVFVEELMGTLVTIAKDVKIQIDFNKEAVASYRLVGYENRVMAAEDFHNDKKDAGEIGAGHTVTALYEIVPAKDLKVDDRTRWLTVKLRYKQPEATESVLIENPLTGQAGQLKLASSDFQFASSVAACGMLLRHSQYAGQANWGLVKELAQAGLSHDPHGHRRSYLGLVAQSESLMGQLRPASPPAPESTVRGKYKSLLRKLNAPGDTEKYGPFNDYGFSATRSYAGSDNLPDGYWVYVAPYWYIWAETTEPESRVRN